MAPQVPPPGTGEPVPTVRDGFFRGTTPADTWTRHFGFGCLMRGILSSDSWSFWQGEAGVILPSLPTEQSVRTSPDELGPRKELLGETKNAQTTSF